ncbi:MetQ/NlpA family ABC transporter substrate-binding protein [Niallia oryzisoli]|uniref:Lipoprotein n=1 Tax=Niallia oryzisoli TaxID=1737571 RepID=A0ABZ2CBG9_9BACI
MKKWLTALFTLVFVLVLAACGGATEEKKDDSAAESKEEMKKLVVGASNVPHAEILEQAKPLLEEKGIELQIETFQDYVLPNQALASGDLDANYFQHIPYFETQIKENGYEFANAGGIHIEPIGIYSKKYKSLKDLPENAKVIISNSVADHGRVLSLLEKEGLITLKEGIDKTAATIDDIVENPRNLEFDTEYAAELLPQIFNNNEGDIVLINSNFAIDAGLNPLKDSIAIEDKESPYVNIIAVRKGDENKEEIKALVEVLHSKEIQDFILEKYDGAVVPVSE